MFTRRRMHARTHVRETHKHALFCTYLPSCCMHYAFAPLDPPTHPPDSPHPPAPAPRSTTPSGPATSNPMPPTPGHATARPPPIRTTTTADCNHNHGLSNVATATSGTIARAFCVRPMHHTQAALHPQADIALPSPLSTDMNTLPPRFFTIVLIFKLAVSTSPPDPPLCFRILFASACRPHPYRQGMCHA